jgi:hypothetical protein
MSVQVNRSLRLPASEYFAQPQAKSGIAIHHTVGGSARSTVKWWRADRAKNGRKRHVGTAYLIDHDGTVFELFDPTGWAYQFGLRWPTALRLQFERRFIGIELASEGGLLEHEGELYCFDRVSPRTWKPEWEAFDCGERYRGYQWFDRYEEAQLEALGRLVDELCHRFAIPRRHPDPPFDYYGDALIRFEGVIGHAMVRRDKSDPAPDPRLWETLGELAAVRPTDVALTERPNAAAPLTSREIESLFEENARRIDAMDVAAGSLVKALLMELERRRTYVRLAEPAPGAHVIGYEMAQGDCSTVLRVASALGFARVSDRLLEVRDAQVRRA